MTLIGSRVEWVLSMLACFRMGAIAMPCNPQLRRKDLELRVEAAKPVLCIGEERYLEQMPPGVPTLGMDDLAKILDEDLEQEPPAEAVDLEPLGPGRDHLHLRDDRRAPGRRLPAALPRGPGRSRPSTGSARGRTSSPGAPRRRAGRSRPATSSSRRGAMGAAAMIHDGRFDPVQRLELLEREGVNVLCQAPTEYRMLAKRAELRPVPGLRRLISAGEPLNPEVIRLFREQVGVPIHDGYGQTETGAIAGMRPGDDDPAKDGSMGRPLPGIEARVARGRAAGAGGDRSDVLRPLPGRGALRRASGGRPATRCAEDDDGYLWFEGRDDDIIVTAGYRVGPFEVESALVTHPAVAEAAAVAAPDPERGSVVRAVVVLREGEP